MIILYQNYENLNTRELALLLSGGYPDISLEKIEDFIQSDVVNLAAGATSTPLTADRTITRNIRAKQKGLSIDYVVKNIWEPENPLKPYSDAPGYKANTFTDLENGVDRNGQLLIDYLDKMNIGTMQITDGMPELIVKGAGKDNDKTYKVTQGDEDDYDAEYISIYEYDEVNDVYVHIDSWGGDSTGGESQDKIDIEEIFDTLGITKLR